jgi:hypothetical protein
VLSAEELDRLCGQTSVVTSCGRKFSFTPTGGNSPADNTYPAFSPVPSAAIPPTPSPRRTPVSVDSLLNDYSNTMSTAQAQCPTTGLGLTTSPGAPDVTWTTNVPTTNGGMSLYEVGYQGYTPAMPDGTATVPLQEAFGGGVGWSGMPYVLDASWQDFVQQLGF